METAQTEEYLYTALCISIYIYLLTTSQTHKKLMYLHIRMGPKLINFLYKIILKKTLIDII